MANPEYAKGFLFGSSTKKIRTQIATAAFDTNSTDKFKLGEDGVSAISIRGHDLMITKDNAEILKPVENYNVYNGNMPLSLALVRNHGEEENW